MRRATLSGASGDHIESDGACIIDAFSETARFKVAVVMFSWTDPAGEVRMDTASERARASEQARNAGTDAGTKAGADATSDACMHASTRPHARLRANACNRVCACESVHSSERALA